MTDHHAEARPLGGGPAPIAVAGLAPALLAGILYLGSTAETVQWGRCGFLCASAMELRVPPPGTSPLWALMGWLWLRIAPIAEPAHSLAVMSGIVGAAAVGVTGLACLEVIRAARGPNPEVTHAPGLRDLLLAATIAMGAAASSTQWGASTAADSRGLSVLLAAGFIYLCLRWRRQRRLTRWSAVALGMVGGLGLTQHLLFFFIAVSGLGPLLIANASEPTPEEDTARLSAPGALWPALLGLALGLLPVLMLVFAAPAYPDGLWPTPAGWGAFEYLVVGVTGTAPFDAGTSGGHILARVRIVELARDVGWLPLIGIALGLVW
ncbi:MAG: DUF2723 domain-containing protein, partial [Armatimonadia bacterium]|nr:DUF2723 domain-containing protein [Armatimonadia bacterium]